MLKRDLTSELVKNFNEILDKILIYKKENKYDECLNLIDNAFKDIFRLSSKFFNSFSHENLIDMIKTDGTINSDKCIMMAKLLEEEGEIFEKQNNLDEAFYMNLKSINLFLEAYLNKDNNCDLDYYFSDIDKLLELVSEYKLPVSLQNKIIDYYAKNQEYDKAENTLYEILDASSFSEDSIRDALDFYEKLLTKDDETLNKANLPREEIEESITSLKQKL
ncbi:DUF6483 family protein [Clostridium sp. DJ247]|uniref:DUF6483 family protein n=1 Tax=Clostridium sp. DJ247 TaxID=2726188 RepID=UPI00162886B0|nr:DUF6483 family protein [Clostridium sp. DJ247]MBC2581136.1 hypothetical protein [Clostridium sp. DJ247]